MRVRAYNSTAIINSHSCCEPCNDNQPKNLQGTFLDKLFSGEPITVVGFEPTTKALFGMGLTIGGILVFNKVLDKYM